MGNKSSKVAHSPTNSIGERSPNRELSMAVNDAQTTVIHPGYALVPLVETSEAVIYSTRVKADTTEARTITSVMMHSNGRYIVRPKMSHTGQALQIKSKNPNSDKIYFPVRRSKGVDKWIAAAKTTEVEAN